MRKQILVTGAGVLLVVAAAIAAWAALRAREQPEWTTSSPAALAELRRGLAAERKLYVAEARQHFTRALELDPQFATAQVMLLRVCDREPQRKELLAGLQTVDRSRLTPREAFLVDYHVETGHERYDKARQRLDGYLAEHPRDPYALDLKSGALWEQQLWPQAEAACKELLALDPNWVTAQNKLGYLSMAQGRFAESEDRFRTYLYVAPDQANPHDSLGELLLLVGRWDDATRELEKALAMRPDFCASYYHLAQIALMQRDVEASGAALERARRQPACAETQELKARSCSQAMWEKLAARDWPALSRAFDEPCEQETHSAYWMPHLGALMAGDVARARHIESVVAKWTANDGKLGKAFGEHLVGVRLLAEGQPSAAADHFAAVDRVVTYFGADLGVYKLYNRLQWAHALEAAGDGERAAKLVGEIEAVNRTMADHYRQGRIATPQPAAVASAEGTPGAH